MQRDYLMCKSCDSLVETLKLNLASIEYTIHSCKINPYVKSLPVVVKNTCQVTTLRRAEMIDSGRSELPFKYSVVVRKTPRYFSVQPTTFCYSTVGRKNLRSDTCHLI